MMKIPKAPSWCPLFVAICFLIFMVAKALTAQGFNVPLCDDPTTLPETPCIYNIPDGAISSDRAVVPPKPQHPKCVTKENGGRYKVYEMSRRRTGMAGRPARWDEDGKYYPPTDPNYYVVTYRCDNWHIWTVEEK